MHLPVAEWEILIPRMEIFLSIKRLYWGKILDTVVVLGASRGRWGERWRPLGVNC